MRARRRAVSFPFVLEGERKKCRAENAGRDGPRKRLALPESLKPPAAVHRSSPLAGALCDKNENYNTSRAGVRAHAARCKTNARPWLPWTRSRSPRGSTAVGACAPFADASSEIKVMNDTIFILMPRRVARAFSARERAPRNVSEGAHFVLSLFSPIPLFPPPLFPLRCPRRSR